MQICTPVAKKSKYMEREVKRVYSRILLSWKLLMFVAKKSKWAIQFVTEQPRLNVISQGIIHLASLQPIHRNPWEKGQSRLLATSIYEDLKRMGAVIDNKPLRLALEFLKRKGVPELLTPPTPVTLSPIDKFYRLKFSFSSNEQLAAEIIQECRREFPDKIDSLRPSSVPGQDHPSSLPTTNTLPISNENTTSTTSSEGDISSASVPPYSATDPEEDDFDSEFGDVEFEDVLSVENPLAEVPITAESSATTSASAPPSGPESFEIYRLRNRRIEDLVKKFHLLRQKVTSIEDRSEWLPRQRADFEALLRRLDSFVEKLCLCSQLNTDVLTSIPDKDTKLVIDVSSAPAVTRGNPHAR